MDEPEPDYLDDYPGGHDEDPWGKYMEDQITELINNLNPGLSAFHYSLNSPLIRDRIDSLLLKLQTNQITNQFIHNKQIWQAAELLKTYATQVDWGTVTEADGLHEWAAGVVFQTRPSTDQFEKLLKRNEKALDDLLEIVSAFWKSTTGETLNKESLRPGQFLRDGVGLKASGWGESFWILHTLVNLINSSTAKGANEIYRSTDWMLKMEKSIPDELEFCVHRIVAGLGRFTAIPGLLYLRDHRRLIDRNMLLMLKDVLVARYCSCISVWKDGRCPCPG
jgi:hypothetical protein